MRELPQHQVVQGGGTCLHFLRHGQCEESGGAFVGQVSVENVIFDFSVSSNLCLCFVLCFILFLFLFAFPLFFSVFFSLFLIS